MPGTSRSFRFGLLAWALLCAGGGLSSTSSIARGQDPTDPIQPAAAQASAETGPFRKLAPGVETTIRADLRADEFFSFEPILDQPQVRIKHDVQALEFTFKPLRMVTVPLPDGAGGLKPTLVWYLVYHVRQPQRKDFETGDPLDTPPMRFYPNFWIEDLYTKRVYPDKLLAPAIAVIQRREDPNRKLLNSIEMMGELAASSGPGDQERWGVVTWDDIDLRIKRFSIFVRGLSTAYKVDPESDPPGKMMLKTLQLNFWRPADAFHSHEDEIRYGIPGEVDYRWFFR